MNDRRPTVKRFLIVSAPFNEAFDYTTANIIASLPEQFQQWARRGGYKSEVTVAVCAESDVHDHYLDMFLVVTVTSRYENRFAESS